MIRYAKNSDIKQICSFDPATAANSQRVTDIKKSIRKKSCWVYEINKQPVAYIVLDDDFFHQAFIKLVYVATSHRKKGIAKDLILYLEEFCRKPKIFTSTNQSNSTMHSLLKKLGYRQAGQVDGLDQGDPEVFYTKSL